MLQTKNIFFSEPFPLFKGRAGPIWAHTGAYGPIWALMGPYGPEKSKKIRKTISFIGAFIGVFKGLCTLP